MVDLRDIMRLKIAELIPIQDAMDNLAAIASIHLENPPPIGIIKGFRLVTNTEELESAEVRWLSSEGSEVLLNVLDLTYRSVYQHLQNLYDNPGMDWQSKKSREGIAAMMSLVGESVSKMNHYLAYRLDQQLVANVGERESYKTLQHYYSEKFAKKMVGGVEGKEAWERAWHEKHSLLEASGSELKDFDALLRDKEYELFYIANEQGEPYLSAELLRNIKLTCDFDVESKSFEEDPFLKVRAMQDRDIQASASQILHACRPEIEQFYKIAKRLFKHLFARSLSKAILALFLASNSRHLIQRTTGKHCIQYFDDFHHFLREAFKSPEYQKWISYPPPKTDQDAHLLLYLIHKLSYWLCLRSGGIKQEAIGLIHRSMRRGEELQPRAHLQKCETVWSQLLFDDEKFRTLLHKFPSGPLFKILDSIRQDQEEGALVPFDPWIQGNLPSRLYPIRNRKKEIQVLRFAAPLCQPMINRVEIIDEFRGFLRFLSSEKKGKTHLLIQLQDRLSWQEMARSHALEQLQKNSTFSSQLVVLTLPKDTDFYHQNHAFADLENADAFIKAFREQLVDSGAGGFYFPSQWTREAVVKFSATALPLVHKYVFDEKATLTRQNREDFIEIVYQLIVAKAIDFFDADFVSFTCKDAVDTGAIAAGIFYGFLKLLQGGLSSKEDLDFLRYLFYWPALSIRERAADPERCTRAFSALATFDSALQINGSKIIKAFEIELG